MVKRPTSVSVVCWITIVTGAIPLISTTWLLNDPTAKQITMDLMSQSPIPIPLQYLMMYVGLLILVGSGIAMLKGKNWGRFLYVTWSIFGFIINFATSPIRMGLIPGLVLFVAFAIILFRPNANQYFSAASPQDDVWPTFTFEAVTLRKVIGMICYILAGLFLAVTSDLASLQMEANPLKYVPIGLFVLLSLVFLGLGLWARRFLNWQRHLGIVLLSVSGLSAFTMLSRIFMVTTHNVQEYLPAGTRVSSSDYISGTVCILFLGLAGGLLWMSGRRTWPNQRSDRSGIGDTEGAGFHTTGNGWIATTNQQSEPKPRSDNHLSAKGVSILEFRPESTARKAGMQKGDVIIEYASERDVTIEHLSALIAKREHEAGHVHVVFVRGGQQHSVTLPSGPLAISAMNVTISVPLKSE
jgi:hypothetical protein